MARRLRCEDKSPAAKAHPKAHRRPSDAWHIVVERPHLGPMASGSGASRRRPPRGLRPATHVDAGACPVSAHDVHDTAARPALAPRDVRGGAAVAPFPQPASGV